MSQFIDKRLNGKNKSAVNRQRFIRRFKQQIKEAVSEAIQKRSIKDIESGERIIIPRRDIDEPKIHHGAGGRREFVLPGNQEFLKGDKLHRPSSGASGSGDSEASDTGEGSDDFSFYITKEEFLSIFFDDLELPDLIKTKLTEIPMMETIQGGFSKVGTPPNLNILRTFRNAIARRLTFKRNYDKKIDELEQSKNLQETETSSTKLKKSNLIDKQIRELKKKKKQVPFIDSFDLRFNTHLQRPKLTTQAVMFCIMDVSGSMDEQKKELAKRFFILLYLFLNRNYKTIRIVFVRHHTAAKEVDEQEFFYSRETGGTVVSSALELVHKIMTERFPSADWNIYIAQASDGDNWNADSPLCGEILNDKILPFIQYYAYVEIMPRHHQSLWKTYLTLQEHHKNFSMRSIDNIKDIYPVLHDLFRRKDK
ncbi:MAG: YeaH/YhbH family protein [Legionellales bacterium]|nr:YeaH/YhbH family protein [Legionellales bacterium]